jgi:hypothetical protein
MVRYIHYVSFLLIISYLLVFNFIYKTPDSASIFLSLYAISVTGTLAYMIAIQKKKKYPYANVNVFYSLPHRPRDIYYKDVIYIIRDSELALLFLLNMTVIVVFSDFIDSLSQILVLCLLSLINHMFLVFIGTFMKYNFMKNYNDILYMLIFFIFTYSELILTSFQFESYEGVSLVFFPLSSLFVAPLIFSNVLFFASISLVVAFVLLTYYLTRYKVVYNYK